VVCLVALVVFVYVIGNTNTVLHEKKIQRQEAQVYQQELATLVKLVEDTTEEREEILSYLLTEDKVIDFLAFIETLGREQNVVLKTDSLTVQGAGNLTEELQVGVSITGLFNSVMRTLSLFEALPYRSYVSNVSLVRIDLKSNIWGATFTLHVTKLRDI
jgi:hypothetical protein